LSNGATNDAVAAFATAHPGCEGILELELRALGVEGTTVEPGGVGFPATRSTLVLANLALRTAGRVLVRVAEFHARSFPELERHGNKLDWDRFLGEIGSVHFRVTAKKSRLNHERAIAERLEKALIRRCPGMIVVAGRSDAADEDQDVFQLPTIQRFVVRLHRDICTISADSSGPLLHRRGYRTEIGKAPLRETLAASLILATGWDGSVPLSDPFCGSGTIPIEAAMIALRIPPGAKRRFSFERWPGFDLVVDSIRSRLLAAADPGPAVAIDGSDRDAGVVVAAAANAGRAGVGQMVRFRQAAISAMPAAPAPGWVITNPPYGERIGNRDSLRDLYAQLGHVLRRRRPGWRLAMISVDRALDREVALDWRELVRTENGGRPVRFLTATIPERVRRD
jgi:putative N6-adenine-specific DNA methylase